MFDYVFEHSSQLSIRVLLLLLLLLLVSLLIFFFFFCFVCFLNCLLWHQKLISLDKAENTSRDYLDFLFSPSTPIIM